jgi:hypothetical protein
LSPSGDNGVRRAAKTRNAVFVYRRAVGDGWAAKRDGVLRADSTRRAERLEPPGPSSRSMCMMARCVGSIVIGTRATRVRTATGRLTPLR